MRIELGTSVVCTDGNCGEVGDVVVDPLRREVTHLVVQPGHRHERARLVPITDVDDGGGSPHAGAVRLRCSSTDLARYPEIDQTAYLRLGEWPPLPDGDEVGVSTVLAVPYADSLGVTTGYVPPSMSGDMLIGYDRIPSGEAELRRGSAVETADGTNVGTVAGFLAGADGVITHLVLTRGHLWCKREITVPATAIARLHTDRVEIALSTDDLEWLPSRRVHRRGRVPAAMVLLVLSLALGATACGRSASAGADQPSGSDGALVAGAFSGLPKPAAAVPLEDPVENGTTTVQSFQVDGVPPDEVLGFYTVELPRLGWVESSTPAAIGDGDAQGTWTRGDESLQVTATPYQGSGGSSSQLDLILTR